MFPRLAKHDSVDRLPCNTEPGAERNLRLDAFGPESSDLVNHCFGKFAALALLSARETFGMQPATAAVACRQSVAFDGIAAVVSLRTSVQMRRSDTAEVAAVAVMEDTRLIFRRLVTSGQDVRDDVCETRSALESEEAVAGLIPGRYPDPTGAKFWRTDRDWPVFTNLRPKAIISRGEAHGSAASVARRLAERPPSDGGSLTRELLATARTDKLNLRHGMNLRGAMSPAVSAARGLRVA